MINNLDKKVRLLDIKISKIMNNTFFGNYKSAFKGKGIEFCDLREYEYHDDCKDIDWKVSARTGKLFIKKYNETRELKIYFLIDVSDSMNFGSKNKTKNEMMLEIFYTLAISAIKNNDKIGAIIYEKDIKHFVPINKGKSVLTNILYKLYHQIQLKNSMNSNLLGTINLLKNLKAKNSLIFIFTDKIDLGVGNILKSLALNNQIVYINFFDQLELNLDYINENLLFGNNFNSINISNLTKIEKQNYRTIKQQQIEDMKLGLLKYGIDYLMFDNDTNVYKTLLTYFKYKNNK